MSSGTKRPSASESPASTERTARFAASMSRTVAGARRRHSSATDAIRNAAALRAGGPAIAVSAFGAPHASSCP
jgi:hypothetical protein